MSIFAFLRVLFYKNVFIFLGVVVFKKNVLSYFMKTYYSRHSVNGHSVNGTIRLPDIYLSGNRMVVGT